MNTSQFKKIANLLTEVYREIKKEALEAGIDILSPEYDQLRAKAREQLLENMGFTVQQYREAKARVSDFSQADMLDVAEETKSFVAQQINEIVIATREEMRALAHEVAKEYIKAPEIHNQIVKETTIEKPQIIKETTIEKTVKEIAYNEQPLRDEIKSLTQRVNELPKPLEADVLRDEFKDFFYDNFGDHFKSNIDIYRMPDFRKLAMGLREDIDALSNTIANSSSSISFETPSGTVDDSNVTFTVAHAPAYVVINGAQYFSGAGYSYAAGTITLSNPVGVGGFIRSAY